MSSFEEVSLRKGKSSQVWNFYLWDATNKIAKCKECKQVLKSGSSTSPLFAHLKSKHPNIVLNQRPKESLEQSQVQVDLSPVAKKAKILDFFQPSTVGEEIARLVAVDKIAFRTISQSKGIQRAFRSDGFQLPKRATDVKDKFMKESKKVQEKVTEKIATLFAAGERCSISFDESTSRRNRRYININAHFKTEFFSLGLVRVHGSIDSKTTIDLVQERLSLYKINLEKDVVALMTDGAAIMKKIGRETQPLHVICKAHTIHLAVCDLLYKKAKSKSKPHQDKIAKDDCGEDDGDDVELDPDDEVVEDEDSRLYEEDQLELENFKPVVDKVRKLVKQFTRSPVKNDKLQKLVKTIHGEELKLKVDCVTRWGSLIDMLRRFLKIHLSIRNACSSFKEDTFDITEQEIKMIKNLCDTLEPIEFVVKRLCQENASLLEAEKVVAFAFQRLRKLNTALSFDVFEKFEARILDNRNSVLCHLLSFLENPSFVSQEKDDFDIKIDMEKIVTLAEKLFNRLFNKNLQQNNDASDAKLQTNRSLEQAEESMSLTENYERFCLSGSRKEPEPKITSEIILQEIGLFKATRKRPPNLESLYQALLTIRPTSVEPERAFSSMNNFCSKLRASMNDDTLSNLVMMSQYYGAKDKQ